MIICAMMAGVGVIVAVVLVFIVSVTWKRANTGARIGAIVICLLALWLAVGLDSPHTAATLAAWTISGFSQLIHGISQFTARVQAS